MKFKIGDFIMDIGNQNFIYEIVEINHERYYHKCFDIKFSYFCNSSSMLYINEYFKKN
jgi:dissimilatory sulfite reductase (desulfoviridin) alpha/beta subunit